MEKRTPGASRRPLVAAGLVLVGLAALYGLAAGLLAPRYLQARIPVELARLTGKEARLGEFAFNPFTWKLRLSGLVIASDNPERPHLSLDYLLLDLEPSSLLKGLAEVKEFTLVRPRVMVEHRANGEIRVAGFLLPGTSPAETAPAAPPAESPPSGEPGKAPAPQERPASKGLADALPIPVRIGNVGVLAGVLAVSDRPRVAYTEIADITLRLPVVSSEQRGGLVMDLPGVSADFGPAHVTISGTASPFSADPFVRLAVTADNFSLQPIQAFLPGRPPLRLSVDHARLDLNFDSSGTAQGAQGKPSAYVNMSLRGLRGSHGLVRADADRLDLEEVEASVYALVDRDAYGGVRLDGTVFAGLTGLSAATLAAEKTPATLDLGKVRLDGSFMASALEYQASLISALDDLRAGRMVAQGHVLAARLGKVRAESRLTGRPAEPQGLALTGQASLDGFTLSETKGDGPEAVHAQAASLSLEGLNLDQAANLLSLSTVTLSEPAGRMTRSPEGRLLLVELLGKAVELPVPPQDLPLAPKPKEQGPGLDLRVDSAVVRGGRAEYFDQVLGQQVRVDPITVLVNGLSTKADAEVRVYADAKLDAGEFVQVSGRYVRADRAGFFGISAGGIDAARRADLLAKLAPGVSLAGRLGLEADVSFIEDPQGRKPPAVRVSHGNLSVSGLRLAKPDQGLRLEIGQGRFAGLGVDLEGKSVRLENASLRSGLASLAAQGGDGAKGAPKSPAPGQIGSPAPARPSPRKPAPAARPKRSESAPDLGVLLAQAGQPKDAPRASDALGPPPEGASARKGAPDPGAPAELPAQEAQAAAQAQERLSPQPSPGQGGSNPLAALGYAVNVGSLAISDFDVVLGPSLTGAPGDYRISGIDAEFRDVGTASNLPLSLRLSAGLPAGGGLRVEGRAWPFVPSADLSLEVRGLDLEAAAKVVPPGIVVTQAKASAHGQLKLDLARMDRPAGSFAGSLGLDGLTVIERATGQELLSLGTLEMTGVETDMERESAKVDRLVVTRGRAEVVLLEGPSVNILRAVQVEKSPVREEAAGRQAESAQASGPGQPARAPAQAAARAGSKAQAEARGHPQLFVRELKLEDFNLKLTDQTVKPSFRTQIEGMNLILRDVGFDRPIVFDLKARVQRAPLTAVGVVTPGKGERLGLALALSVEGMDMTQFTPYARKYVGQSISRGLLNLKVDYNIKNLGLTAANSIKLKNITLVKSQEQGLIHLPISLALAILQDEKGEINLDIPIKGTLDKMQLGLSDVIGDAFGGFFAKVLLSPFAVLRLPFGDGQAASIPFAPDSAVLDPGQNESLAKLAEVLKQKTLLSLELQGLVDPKADDTAIRRTALRVKLVELVRRFGGNPEDESQLNDALPMAYAAQVGRSVDPRRAPPAAEMEKTLLAVMPAGPEEQAALAAARAEAVRQALAALGVDKERLFVLQGDPTQGQAGHPSSPRVELRFRQ